MMGFKEKMMGFKEKAMNLTEKTEKYRNEILAFAHALTLAFVLYLVSASWSVGVCGFISSLIYRAFDNRKFLKYTCVLPLLIPFFLPTSKFLTTVSIFLFLVLEREWKKGKGEGKGEREWFASVFLPFGIYFIIEFLQRNAKGLFIILFSYQEIQHYGHLYGILVVLLFFVFMHLFFSKKISWYITTAFFCFLGLINYFVISFTSQPFIPSDFKIAGTAFSCLSSQKLTGQDVIILISGLLMICLFYVLIALFYKNENRDVRKVGHKATSLFLVFVFVFFSWATIPWFKQNLLLFNANKKYGFVTNFIISLDSGIHAPNGIDDYVIEDKDNEGDFKPNVIIVMNEAFSDLNGVFGLDGEDNLKYFNSLREKYPSGTAYTSVKGNNTCSSEWEALSGVSTALTAKGSMIYQDNCKFMNSLVNVFNRRGYYTVGVHPYGRSGYNRDNLYSAIGFQEKVFDEDFVKPNTIRGFITDEDNYKKIIELYEENNDGPFFCFNITMQNHGGYERESKVVKPFSTTNYPDVNRYLSLVNVADNALRTLIEYFENVEEPTIILFFGDHQPLITNSFYEEIFKTKYEDLTLEQIKNIYEVPYLIWANYEINGDAAPKEVSINYLPSVLFDVGNIPSTTWLDMLDSFREEWPVITTNFAKNKSGDLVTLEDAKKDSTVHEYLMRSYAILKGEIND